MSAMSSAAGGGTQRAVFLSYASQDAEAAGRLCEALRVAGVEVWFDQNELRGGDAWDRKIKQQIRECALFVPIVSANTQARPEGYFRLEWHLAEQRSLLIAKGRPFLVPVGIDATSEREALVPDAFLAVQWTRFKGDEATATASFAERVKRLLAGEVAPASSRPSRNAGRMPALLSEPSIPDYELLRKIGSGSYGDVWLARGLTGAYRAVKIVWRERFADAAPFEREFRGLKEFTAMSSEANQLALLHVGQDERAGFFYYVMELADDAATGRTIDPARYVPLTAKELKARRGRLPAAECVTFGVELARSLAGLHARGLLHRDIKPSNVILVNGVPKLADIGLVASSSDARTFVGTEGFVPPEGPGTPAADVFALGKLLYELATGRDRAEFPNLPEDLGEPRERKALFALNDVLLRACDAAPAQRYRDAGALLADLLALQAGISLRHRRVGKKTFRFVAVAAAIAAAVTGGVFARKLRPVPTPPVSMALPVAVPEQKSVAVLAFANLSEDKSHEYFSDGISEELLNVLAKIPGLKVSGRTSAFSFKGRSVSAAEIARQLGVTYIIDGSVRRVGDQVRITAQLIKAADEAQVWTETFERDARDIFAVQDEVAARIATKLQLKFVAGPVATAVNPEAFELYLQGRQQWNIRTAPALAQAEEFFNRALALDPKLIRAHAGLADVALLRGQLGKRIDFYPDREAPALAAIVARIEQALALDPNLAETHTSLGGARLFGWDFAGAERELRQAIGLNPNYGTAHQWLGRVLIACGRMDEGLAELKLAASIDPLSSRIVDNYARTLMLAGRLTEALTAIDRSLAVSPGQWQATNFKIDILLRLNRDAEALAMVREIEVQDPTFRIGPPPALLARVGLRREAEAVFKPTPSGANDAGSLLALDRREEALATLTPDRIGMLELDALLFRPTFDEIRTEPRFVRMIAGIGLTEAHARAQAWRAAHPVEATSPPKVTVVVPAADAKSLVVLPLENLSPDPENAFFTDGMHSEIIATLSRIPDLKVMSRTSALSLKGSALSLAETAKKVGAANVMAGSVRRAGQQICIQLELRRASDEALLWSRTYAQELTDPLALQSDIAENVARALQARESKGAFGGAQFSTKNPQAFDLFLKARGLFEIGDFRGEGMLQAKKLLDDALALDAEFVSASSLQANLVADLARGSLEPAQRVALAAEAKRYAELASRLAPGGAGDGHLAFYYAVIEGNGSKALVLADNAVRALPNDAIHHNIRGIALSQLGRVAEGLEAYRRARELDPLVPVFRTNELQGLIALRRTAEFEAAIVSDQGRKAAADGLVLMANYELKGELPDSFKDFGSLLRITWLWRARRFAEADTEIAQVRTRPPFADINRWGMLCRHSDVLRRLGRVEDAAQAARESYEFAQKLQAVPEIGPSSKDLYLARSLVRLGRHDEAVAAARRYVGEASVTTQTGTRWKREIILAEIYAHAGRKRECIELLAKLINLPGARITVPVLRLEPDWDNLRDDPGFQALLADPKNSEPL